MARASSHLTSLRDKAEPQGGPISEVQAGAKPGLPTSPSPAFLPRGHSTSLVFSSEEETSTPILHSARVVGVCLPWRCSQLSPLREEGGWRAVWESCVGCLCPLKSVLHTQHGPEHCRTGEGYAPFHAKPRLSRKPFMKPPPTSTHSHGSPIFLLPPPH